VFSIAINAQFSLFLMIFLKSNKKYMAV